MKNKHKQISLILLCGAFLVGCGRQEKSYINDLSCSSLLVSALLVGCEQEKSDMTVDQAFDYLTEPNNHCYSNISQRSKYCDYAGNLYDDAKNKVQNKVRQDPIIQRLLTKAQVVDCYNSYPEPAVCVAVDMRSNEIVMKVVKELGISATKPIFDTGSAFIQGKFNQQLQEQEANKLLSESD